MPFTIILEPNGISGYRVRHDGYSGQPRCIVCAATLDIVIQKYDCVNKPNSTTGDISMTADGVFIVSRHFCDVYYKNRLTGLVFSQLSNGYMAVDTTEVAAIPPSKYRIYDGEPCKSCGQYPVVKSMGPVWTGIKNPQIFK